MATCTATFSDGTKITRNTERQYAAAYRVTVDGGELEIGKGFSASRDAAAKAASGFFIQSREQGGGGAKAYKNRGPVVEIVSL